MFTEQEIESNYEEYCTLLSSTEAEGIENLISYLTNKTDMKVAPCSTRFHLCCQGGLVKHSLNVYYRLLDLITRENMLEKYKLRSLIIAALCHDLVKTNYYEPTTKNEKIYSDTGSKRDELGSFDWVSKLSYKTREENNRLTFGLHAENSIFILNRFVKDVSYEEMLAIRWHMGCLDWQDNPTMVSIMGSAFSKSPLAMFLHMADMLASTIDEKDM